MILPTKHTITQHSIIGKTPLLFRYLYSPILLDALWLTVKQNKLCNNYYEFIVLLEFLYVIGLIEFDNGFIVKKND